MCAIHINDRVKKHREALRKAGLRPVQLWVPDTRRPGFDDECRRQSLLAAQADRRETDLDKFMDAVLLDIEGWEDQE